MFKVVHTVRLYMKSGNIVELDNITKFDIKYRGETLTEYSYKAINPSNRLMWFDLTQVEAVQKVRTRLIVVLNPWNW